MPSLLRIMHGDIGYVDTCALCWHNHRRLGAACGHLRRTSEVRVVVSGSDIRTFLEERGWEFAHYEEADQERFLFTIECAGGLLLHIEITLSEEGQFLQFLVPDLLRQRELESSPYRRRVLAAIGEETYRRRLAKVGYDPSDGEIDCCVDLPLEDCPLTRRQFEYALHLLIIVSRLVHRRAVTILKTGRDPGPLEVQDLERPG